MIPINSKNQRPYINNVFNQETLCFPVADITALNKVETSTLKIGCSIVVLDKGDSTVALFSWNGTIWVEGAGSASGVTPILLTAFSSKWTSAAFIYQATATTAFIFGNFTSTAADNQDALTTLPEQFSTAIGIYPINISYTDGSKGNKSRLVQIEGGVVSALVVDQSFAIGDLVQLANLVYLPV